MLSNDIPTLGQVGIEVVQLGIRSRFLDLSILNIAIDLAVELEGRRTAKKVLPRLVA